MTTNQTFFNLKDSDINITIRNFHNSINENTLLLNSAIETYIFIRDNDHEQTEQTTLNLLREQIVLYNSIVDDLNANLKTLINNSFDKKRLYIPIPKNTLMFTDNDLNEYITIDKRQTLEKNNIHLFIKKEWVKGKISKTEYRNYTRRNIQSDNIRQRIHAYITHSLLKIRHKKQYSYLRDTFKGFKDYAYIDGQNIRLNNLSKDLNENFILYEIEKKRETERNIFTFEKLTY